LGERQVLACKPASGLGIMCASRRARFFDDFDKIPFAHIAKKKNAMTTG
jgi:hypothetical protein